MKALRGWFLGVLAAMLAVTVWASLQDNVLAAGARLLRERWFVATLFDTYFAFAAFGLWVCWKEPRWRPRILWLAAIAALGNLAMAVFALRELRRAGDMESFLAARNPR